MAATFIGLQLPFATIRNFYSPDYVLSTLKKMATANSTYNQKGYKVASKLGM